MVSERPEAFHFFWQTESPFSQWYKSTFSENGQKFESAEQYMMYRKAKLFNDENIAAEILHTKDPKKVKALGRKVTGFNDFLWKQHRESIVYDGNCLKFSQDAGLKDYILSTGDSILVEASPHDSIWGIGMLESDPDATNMKRWRGLNLLGKCLMQVRHTLLSGVDNDESSLLLCSGHICFT